MEIITKTSSGHTRIEIYLLQNISTVEFEDIELRLSEEFRDMLIDVEIVEAYKHFIVYLR